MNTTVIAPRTLADAVERGWKLASEQERQALGTLSADEAELSLHLTLGHKLRGELGLWTDDAWPLFDDINQQLPDYLAVDADTASAAIISVLWAKANHLNSGP